MQKVARWIAGVVSVLVLLVILLAFLFSLATGDPWDTAREAAKMERPELLSSETTNSIRGGTATVTVRDENDAQPPATIKLRRPFWSPKWRVVPE